MAAITYPAALPDPQSLTLRDAERRALQSMAGNAPASTRALERDYRGTASVTHVFTAEQFAAWNVWREMLLAHGGAWFQASSWPFPWGRGAAVRYSGEASVEHIGRGFRRVEAQLEVRGLTEAPVRPEPPYPMTITEATDEEIVSDGAELVAQTGAIVVTEDGLWQIPSLGYAEPGAARSYAGRFLPTRGALLSGPVQMRGTSDASAALGRLGFTVGVSSFVDAGAMFAAGYGTRRSRITGASPRGAISTFIWDDPITTVHVAVLGLGSYAVQNSGPVSAADGQMLRLTFSAADEIRALYIHEGPPTNFAGAAGTGSARFVTVLGMQLP